MVTMPSLFALVKADRVAVSIQECGAGEDENPDENSDYYANCCIRACNDTPSPHRCRRPDV